MDWDEASDRIWNSFCELEDELQVEMVENSAPTLVHIFPMNTFNSFCKKKMHGDFQKVGKAVLDGADSYDMDFSQPWCLYDETNELFRSGDTPADFVDNEEYLTSELRGDEDMLSQLGFSDEESEELRQAYEEE